MTTRKQRVYGDSAFPINAPPSHFGFPRQYFNGKRWALFRFHHSGKGGNLFGSRPLHTPCHAPQVPAVTIMPRSQFVFFADSLGDELGGTEVVRLPFSTTDFRIDIDSEAGLFREFDTDAYRRMMGLPQLCHLIPPPDIQLDGKLEVEYPLPYFRHTRWEHGLLTAVFANILLSRNGFSPDEIARVCLAFGHHDVAMVAGGDAVIRIDPEALNEERLFSTVLASHGLDRRWRKRYGFDLSEAAAWVRNEGLFGRLLDVLDKISYVALDCCALGYAVDGQVRRILTQHPFLMDLWQDIRFTADHKQFAFTNPQRLYDFLLLRAYEHTELLRNPACRVLDLLLTQLVTPLYREGILTKDVLLRMDFDGLCRFLRKHYNDPDILPRELAADDYTYHKFGSQRLMDSFFGWSAGDFNHVEYVDSFNTGLGMPVFAEHRSNTVVPLGERISSRQRDALEALSSQIVGFYVYCKHPLRP